MKLNEREMKKRDQILSRYHNNADKGDTGTKNEETSQLYFPS